MRMIGKTLLITAMIIGLFVPVTRGAGVNKIGIIDFQKILETSNAGKAAQEKINTAGKKMEAELQEKGKEIEALQKNLERENMVLNKEARDEKQREIRIKINDAKTLEARYRRDIKRTRAQVIQKIEKEVFDVAQKIAKESGFQLILEKRAGGVIYFEPAWEITAQVIEKYNAEFAASGNKE
ncbi:MAG: hypothetical protein DSY89_01495 [Deltaproteobacteria bacterium]|nr:MAG: hypothetical protein DSY89_01495 [Deltaproteobacteria bacterium]